MTDSQLFSPHSIYAREGAAGQPPRVFIAPQRYIQGAGVLHEIGRYLRLLGAGRVGVLISHGGHSRHGPDLAAALGSAAISWRDAIFGGECSIAEIDNQVAALAGAGLEALLAVGGGKCVDAGKAIAHRLGIPVVIVPTLASNDAPCSALSVTYTPDGVAGGVEFYPQSPAIVVVDTAIVASAPERFLVSGMGDAMATWYEARVALANPAGRSSIGGRPTLAATAIGEVCAATLYDHGLAAAHAVAANRVDSSLELIVEANTLLSGLGFESGGLAAAHGVASSCTAVPVVHDGYLHGEMVAFGVLTQLMMEGLEEEAERVARFFIDVGLPVHLGHLSLDPGDSAALDVIAAGTTGFPMIDNMPMRVDADLVRTSVLAADRLGRAAVSVRGDAAYTRLHA